MFVPDSDVNDSDFSLPLEGWHRVEVSEAERRTSKKNDAFYNLTLVDPNTKSVLAWDVVMLEGKGNGIGIRKLAALGAARRMDGGWQTPDHSSEVVGCRAWAYLAHEKYRDDGGNEKTRVKVAIDRGEKGYLAEDDTPPTAEMPTPLAAPADDGIVDPFADDDIPF